MSQALMDFIAARHDVETAAARLHLAGLTLSDDPASAVAVNEAQDALAVAARKLTLAVDGLPVDRRPKGWDAVRDA